MRPGRPGARAEGANVPGTVERVEAGPCERRRVADVMQVGGGDQRAAVGFVEQLAELPGTLGDGLAVAPAVAEAGEQGCRLLLGPADQLVSVHMATVLASCRCAEV